MTTDELIEELKKYPGKTVVSWYGDGIGYMTLKAVELETMTKWGEETYDDTRAYDPPDLPREEVVVL